MNNDDINEYLPSVLNPRGIRKQNVDLNTTQRSVASRCSLSLKKRKTGSNFGNPQNEACIKVKGNNSNNKCIIHETDRHLKSSQWENLPNVAETLGFSAIDDLKSVENDNHLHSNEELQLNNTLIHQDNEMKNNTLSTKSDSTVIYNFLETTVVSVSFGIADCKKIDVSAKNSNIKDFSVFHNDNNTNIHCNLVEDNCLSFNDELENIDDISQSPTKKQAVSVNLEIKRKKSMSTDYNPGDDVLILKTNAIEKISHVIVQPPNYKLVKRKLKFREKLKTRTGRLQSLELQNGQKLCSDNLKQKSILNYLCNSQQSNTSGKSCIETVCESTLQRDEHIMFDDVEDMIKNSGVPEIVIKSERTRPTSFRAVKENDIESRSKLFISKRYFPNKQQDIKAPSSEVPRNPSPRFRNGSISSCTPRKNVESFHFSLPSKSKSNKTNFIQRNVPFYKIVAETHFAVDAFSYGDIPNVNNYFLTHFHSDHYSGLKKSFNKLLFCSQITANLCTSRLGVNPKCIQVLSLDETITVEGIEVTAVDANHCPGAVMLVFTLPNGKTFLHTGDFRASPDMESYPIFWNKDIHTVYLDTTYCNPRYDFPTQDQSLEMALHLLRQKKTSLEEGGKKFSSVLIVCGTYTIGKEKFFKGVARRVGCSVWACPEKERVLRHVEGREAPATRAPPHLSQLHVVPMRDLTHEKLRAYLDSMQGAFSEVVAFKPSGWESGKETAVQRDLVTIHGIPYSEHSSFPEMIRFVNFLKPKQVVPTVDIAGGVKAVQKYFPCPLVYKEDLKIQSRVTDYFRAQSRQQVHAVS